MKDLRKVLAGVIFVATLAGLIWVIIFTIGDSNYNSQTSFDVRLSDGDKLYVGTSTAIISADVDKFFAVLGPEYDYQSLTANADKDGKSVNGFLLTQSQLLGGWHTVVTECDASITAHITCDTPADFKVVHMGLGLKIIVCFIMLVFGLLVAIALAALTWPKYTSRG